MARNYPRFLFSNPSNTKTPGPFIVHLLNPKFIATCNKIGWDITWLDDASKDKKIIAVEAMHNWFQNAYPDEHKKIQENGIL